MKFVDLFIQTVMLLQILENGVPIVLVAVFTVIVAANAVGCALVMLLPFEQTALVENVVDLIFDLLIAVEYPVIVVCYCLSTFNFDRAKLAINLEVFPPGWIEQAASTIADPVQTVVIYKSLKSLRISSVFNFFTRMGINVTLWLKYLRITNIMGNPRKQSSCVYPKRHRLAAASLVVFALFLIVYVEESTRTSAIACRPHPESLMYTHTQTFPSWIKELKQLEYLHVEGKATIGLVSLPVDMFDEMSSLTTLHLGSNVALPRLPSFHRLTNLKMPALAASMALEELPAFDSLHKLERLVIAIAPLLDSLPDFSPIHDLKSFVTIDRGTWCCNGFLGECDLQNP
ncbi:hypothetical protein JG688_00001143, partial [Phytophthora aleatoria]